MRLLFTTCFIILAQLVHCQSFFLPASYHLSRNQIEREDIKGNYTGHFGLGICYNENSFVDSFIQSKKQVFFLRKYFSKYQGSAYRYKDEYVDVHINPVIDYTVTRDALGTYVNNSRGLEVKGNIDGKISFYSFITDNQASFPLYIDQRIIQHSFSMPGEYWLKSFKQGEVNLSTLDEIGTVDFFSARAFINFKLSNSIDVQFGHDKNKLGYGYRSLALSDYSTAYPFLKVESKFGNIRYQNLFAELNDFPNLTTNNLIRKKYFASHTLSWNIGETWNFSLFENIMFARQDTSVDASFEIQYLNPVIFYRGVEHGLGSPDNASLGVYFKKDIKKKVSLYGQFYLDDIGFQNLRADIDSQLVKFGLKSQRSYSTYAIWTNKWASQLGLKYIDAFGVKNLDLQLETNRVKPYTYSHRDRRQAYMHNSQPLAHPLGANFKERIFIVNYDVNEKVRMEIRYFNVIQGLDSINSNWGSDISKDYFKPGASYPNYYYVYEHNYNSTIGRGVDYQMNMIEFSISYALNYNLMLDFVVKERRQKSELVEFNQNNRLISLGLRWNIDRKYFDF